MLQEFYVQATRATRPDRLDIEVNHGFSYWDGAIIAAARALGCRELYSDDMATAGKLKAFSSSIRSASEPGRPRELLRPYHLRARAKGVQCHLRGTLLAMRGWKRSVDAASCGSGSPKMPSSSRGSGFIVEIPLLDELLEAVPGD